MSSTRAQRGAETLTQHLTDAGVMLHEDEAAVLHLLAGLPSSDLDAVCRWIGVAYSAGRQSTRSEMDAYRAFLVALDRCVHGRHKQDPCFSCGPGPSIGNLFLTPGQRIGTTLYGTPIEVPLDEADRRDPSRWSADGTVK